MEQNVGGLCKSWERAEDDEVTHQPPWYTNDDDDDGDDGDGDSDDVGVDDDDDDDDGDDGDGDSDDVGVGDDGDKDNEDEHLIMAIVVPSKAGQQTE